MDTPSVWHGVTGISSTVCPYERSYFLVTWILSLFLVTWILPLPCLSCPVAATKLGSGVYQGLPFSYHKSRECIAGSQILVTLGDITWSPAFGSKKRPHLEMELQLPDAAVVLQSGNLLGLSVSVQYQMAQKSLYVWLT